MNDSQRMRAQKVDSSGTRTAVVVLGMHRSGSSALGGFIHLLGATAPAHMSRPDDFNAKGYWESSAIRLFNDRVLQSVGSEWKDWGPFDFEQAAPKVQDWESELAELIRQEFGESPLLVVKDPRLCRMAPILLRALERLAIAPKVILTVRNPLESAQSLQTRDRMSREEALLLWLRHVLDAEKASRGYRRCFVAFDDLLDDWRRVADRLAKGLDLVWPRNSAETGDAVDEFLSSSLRHHRIPREELKEIEPDLAWVSSVYDVLLDLTHGMEPTEAQLAHLDDVRRNFDAATPALRSVIRARNDLVREAQDRESAARERIELLEAQVQDVSRRAHAEVKDARQQIARLHADLQELSTQAQRQAEEARKQTEEARKQTEEARKQAEEARKQTEEVQKQLARSMQESESYRTKLETSDRARSEMEVRVSALEAQNLQSWRDLVQTRVSLHKALQKDGGHRPLLRRLGAKPRMTKGEREKRQAGLIRASGLFDLDWYLSRYPDVTKAGMDPILHYLRHGAAEGRDPSPRFSTSAYLRRHLDVASAKINPLIHFLEHGVNEQRQIEPAGGISSAAFVAAEPTKQEPAGGGVTAEHLKFTRRGPEYEEFDPTILAGATPDVKLLAFYLPQFHAIPENDVNWGKGFTEWRQIVRGLPRFPGHYQPRVPRDLGFYDLTDPNVMRRQIALAKAAGIYGFGFYYYWFDSHRVLEQPFETFLASPDMDMPFMAIWANENWTRTWDGMSGEILLQQSYDLQHEPALLADLARHFKDPRYIRFGDRPFFVIYQPRHVPDARETFARWRMRWKSEFGLEPLIFMAQTFGVEDPREFGLDGAIEFPPHKLARPLSGRSIPDAFSSGLTARVLSYDDIAATSLSEQDSEFPLIKTIVPSWDNDARRPMRGMIFEGSTPQKYQDWLLSLVKRARIKPVFGQSIVAINAWNEWAEAAYLEPDVYYGSAYLNATARVLTEPAGRAPEPFRAGIVLVGHDTYDHGAQRILLNIASTLVRGFGVRVHSVLLGDGPLLAQYEELGPCTALTRAAPDQVRKVFSSLAGQGFRLGIANTTVAGRVAQYMKTAGFHIVSLVHELPQLIRNEHLEQSAAEIARLADVVVFPSKFVHDSFGQIAGPIAGRVTIHPQGLYRAEVSPRRAAREAVRAELGLPADARIVLNVGYGDLRKGFDLFARAAAKAAGVRPDVFFVWVGRLPQHAPEIDARHGPKARDSRTVIACGHRENVADYYAAADVFFLSSREDPYPSVVLEAMATGLPVVAFGGATGCEDLIAAHGVIVPAGDLDAVAAAIGSFLDAPPEQVQARSAARIAEIRSRYSYRDYCFCLLQQFDPDLKRISVIVPNYNHARYLEERLASIFHQTYPIYQIVVLDDASTDSSLQTIRSVAKAHHREIQVLANNSNSGSLAKQWQKGLAECAGDYVWIAESDDLSHPVFLSEAVRVLEESGAQFCFTDSWQMDGTGNRTGGSYISYVDEIEPGTFTKSFVMPGPDFLARFLAVKNVILNMSGVLWRREALIQAMTAAAPDLEALRITADWRLYIAACAAGHKVAYLAKALNGHRRHERSITSSLDKQRHADEVRQMQALAARGVVLAPDAIIKAEKHLAHVDKYLGLA